MRSLGWTNHSQSTLTQQKLAMEQLAGHPGFVGQPFWNTAFASCVDKTCSARRLEPGSSGLQDSAVNLSQAAFLPCFSTRIKSKLSKGKINTFGVWEQKD